MVKNIIKTSGCVDSKQSLEVKWSEKDESRLLNYLEFLSSSNNGYLSFLAISIVDLLAW